MPEELSREIRKLEIRLEGYFRKAEGFVKESRKCLGRFAELNKNLEESAETEPKQKASEKPFLHPSSASLSYRGPR